MSVFRRLSRVILAFLLLAAVGCGARPPAAHRTTGEVLYKNAPLADAQIAFIPKDGQGRLSRGTTRADGTFEMTAYTPGDGALAGEHLVTIVKMAVVFGKAGDPYAVMKSTIPDKYGSPTASPLTANVVAGGTNHFKFELVE